MRKRTNTMPTLYDIKRDGENIVIEHLDDTDDYYKEWKKGKLSDRIVIRCTGRNEWARKHYKKDIIYAIYDFSVPPKKRKKPLEIVIIYEAKSENSNPAHIAVLLPYITDPRYHSSHSAVEFFASLIAVDKQYTKTGGGVNCKNKFHRHPELVKELSNELQRVVAPLS